MSPTHTPRALSDERTLVSLCRGDEGADVGELRRRLALLGHATGPDRRDHYGPATTAAVAEFQRTRGLDPSGACDQATWSILIESEYQLGDRLLCLRAPMMRGEDIADLQLRLGTLGFDSGRVDGIFGTSTQRAVGDFQRNAGIVFDQVCGPDTVAALKRLEGRAGSSTIASVRERVTVLNASGDLSTLRIVIGSPQAGDLLSSRLAGLLAPLCQDIAVTDGDASAQAAAANSFGADLFLGLEYTTGETIEARYFSVPGFESYGGRSLAEAIIAELPATGLGVARGMRLPVLRETRSPAVALRLGHGLAAPQHRELVATSLLRALSSWRSSEDRGAAPTGPGDD